MATLPAGLSQKDIDRYAQLDAGIKRIAEEHAALNDKIKKAHEAAGITGKKTLTYPSEKYGVVVVALGEQKRVDADALEAALPQNKHPELWVSRLDQKLVDKTILDRFRTNIVQTLSIKVAE